MQRIVEDGRGFTLVELMVVVMIIGILVSIATPVYLNALGDTEARSCMANQRSITGSIDMYSSMLGSPPTHLAGELAPGGSGWYATLVPAWITNGPLCPTDKQPYYLTASGDIVGDQGAVSSFKPGHEAR